MSPLYYSIEFVSLEQIPVSLYEMYVAAMDAQTLEEVKEFVAHGERKVQSSDQ